MKKKRKKKVSHVETTDGGLQRALPCTDKVFRGDTKRCVAGSSARDLARYRVVKHCNGNMRRARGPIHIDRGFASQRNRRVQGDESFPLPSIDRSANQLAERTCHLSFFQSSSSYFSLIFFWTREKLNISRYNIYI